MKLTIITLVIVEGNTIQGIYHSLEEHPGKAYQELVDQVENEFGYDADKDHVPGISMYGHYIACKSLDISSEEEYMNQLTDIELICNEL